MNGAGLAAIAAQVPASVVIAVGMTFVLISGGIDLSVGSVLALSSAVLGACLIRLGWPLPLAAAERLGLRVVLIERPGSGLSDSHEYAAVADFARDMTHIADALGADRLGVVGLSGGGPYALSCAAVPALANRVAAIAVLGGVDVGGNPAHGGQRDDQGRNEESETLHGKMLLVPRGKEDAAVTACSRSPSVIEAARPGK